VVSVRWSKVVYIARTSRFCAIVLAANAFDYWESPAFIVSEKYETKDIETANRTEPN